MPDFATLRDRMIERQIRRRGVENPLVLDAMRAVPREAFVPEDAREYAYSDGPLPIGSGQTISQPFIVAAMIDVAEVKPGSTVLEIGAGSGYAAAVISRIAAKVYAIERHARLTDEARERFAALGYDNIELRTGDGTFGWPEAAPFDAIIASAGGPCAPQALQDQLAIGGVLAMPVGPSPHEQRLVKLRRFENERFEEADIGAVSFVPLIGAHGWSED
jgi:protein-L-isoaspartate(D-aspartate) O-methyltransferase